MAENFVTTGEIVVPFSDDEEVREDELITDEDKSLKLTNPKAYEDRLEKRRVRAREREKERKEQSEALKTERAEKEELKQRLARLEGAVVATQRQPQADRVDPYQSRLDAIYEKQSNAWQTAQAEIKAGTFDDKRAAHYQKIAREVDEERTSVLTERAIASRVPAQRQEQAQQVWMNKHPEVYGNPAAYQYAEATFKRRQALGEAINNDTVDEIMNEAKTVFKLGKRPAPTATERERMSGIPSSGSAGNGGGATGGIPMTKELRKMATSLYSDLSEDEAIKKWVSGPGKELRKQKVL